MPSRRTNNFPESGRGLGHVTPTIFGSTIGFPRDSLASCFVWLGLVFHPRDAMHKRTVLPKYVSVRPSVYPSVCNTIR